MNAALDFYTSQGYIEINNALRQAFARVDPTHQKTGSSVLTCTLRIRHYIKDLITHILLKGRLPREYVTLYKFTDHIPYKDAVVGQEFTDAGFFSQTDNFYSAYQSAKCDGMGCLLHVSWKSLPPALHLREEDEVLTLPGVRLTVYQVGHQYADVNVEAGVEDLPEDIFRQFTNDTANNAVKRSPMLVHVFVHATTMYDDILSLL